MIIEGFDKDYQVKEYTMDPGGEITLKWKYAKGTHFFVLLYDSRMDVSLEGIIQEMEDKGMDDKSVVQKVGHQLYVTSDERVKVFLFREREFVQNGQSCVLPAGGIKRTSPYGISVFIGEYDKTEESMHIYQVKDAEINTRFVPVKLEPEIHYKTRILSKEKLCILHVPYIQDYEDGALQYHVDGVRMTYPLPAGCLGKDLVIAVPKDSSVAVRVSDKYKKYYRV